MTNGKVPLSVVIIAKNEEDDIAEGLESVHGWADEIIVVDDCSTDKTVEIAKKFTDKVFTRKMEIQGIHRNWAYAQARNLWVLSMDADEKVTPELRDEIIHALKTNTKHVVFSVPLRNYIGKYWVKHGGWYPAPKDRLFRKDKFKYEEVKVHPRAFYNGTCGHLTKDMIHKGYPDLQHYFFTLNRQTTWEAEKWYNQGRPMRLGHMLWRTIDRFMRSYVGKGGWKDGYIGFVIAFNSGLYQFVSYLKYIEIEMKKAGKM